MRIVHIAVALLVAAAVSGCSIPTRAIDDDGILQIVVLPHSYEVGDKHFIVPQFLEIAIGRLDTSKVKEARILMSTDNVHAYGPVYRALGKKKIPYGCYDLQGKPSEYSCPLETIAI
jgi:hypothetical protein